MKCCVPSVRDAHRTGYILQSTLGFRRDATPPPLFVVTSRCVWLKSLLVIDSMFAPIAVDSTLHVFGTPSPAPTIRFVCTRLESRNLKSISAAAIVHKYHSNSVSHFRRRFTYFSSANIPKYLTLGELIIFVRAQFKDFAGALEQSTVEAVPAAKTQPKTNAAHAVNSKSNLTSKMESRCDVIVAADDLTATFHAPTSHLIYFILIIAV